MARSSGRPSKPRAKAVAADRPGGDEPIAAKKRRAKGLLKSLHATYGEVTCALHHDSALQLLIATILSAQSTDETVNKVTPALFQKYRTASDFAAAEAATLEREVHSTGFFRQKTKSIQGACKILQERHGGQVPGRMEELLELPGVARKTANVVLGTWFGLNEGIVVDTHVGRLAERLGLTWTSKNAKDTVKIETDLTGIVPREEWTYLSHALIRHGRAVCSARKPRCSACPLASRCPSAVRFLTETG